MDSNTWMNDPALKNIDASKLQLLSSIAAQANGKSPNELLPFFMSAMNQTNSQGISFSQPERELLLNILMQRLSPQEKAKAETILRMTHAFQKQEKSPKE